MFQSKYIYLQISNSLILSWLLFSAILEGIGISQQDIFFPIFLIAGALLFLFSLTKLLDEPFENIYKELPKIYNSNFLKLFISCLLCETIYIVIMEKIL